MKELLKIHISNETAGAIKMILVGISAVIPEEISQGATGGTFERISEDF